MADQIAEQTESPAWNLDRAQWEAILRRASASGNALEDGAFVGAEDNLETGQRELVFFAAARNKPAGWTYPFLEAVPRRGALRLLAMSGMSRTQAQFTLEVSLLAAAQALAADYESGASDLDFVAYEQAAEQAVRGTPADLAWLHQEFGRLALLSVS